MNSIFEGIDIPEFIKLRLYEKRFDFCNYVKGSGCDNCKHHYLCCQIEYGTKLETELKTYLKQNFPEEFL